MPDSRSHGRRKLTNGSEPCFARAGQASAAFPMSERYRIRSSQPSISSALVSPARTFLRLDAVPGLQGTRVDCGLRSPVWLAQHDVATCSWRTRQGCLNGEWAQYSAIWPASGSMRSGQCYRLPFLVPRTYERASGFWPTPVASETKRTTPYAQGGQSLTYTLGGRPNPRWVEWLMGFPVGWLELSEMPSVPQIAEWIGRRILEAEAVTG